MTWVTWVTWALLGVLVVGALAVCVALRVESRQLARAERADRAAFGEREGDLSPTAADVAGPDSGDSWSVDPPASVDAPAGEARRERAREKIRAASQPALDGVLAAARDGRPPFSTYDRRARQVVYEPLVRPAPVPTLDPPAPGDVQAGPGPSPYPRLVR